MCGTVLHLWKKQRALTGPEDNRNNSLFIRHLLCARSSSKRLHKIVHVILPPPSEVGAIALILCRGSSLGVKAGLVGGAEL